MFCFCFFIRVQYPFHTFSASLVISELGGLVYDSYKFVLYMEETELGVYRVCSVACLNCYASPNLCLLLHKSNLLYQF